ncbi:hypothetical protein ACIHFD_13570 [Nonomuraea sp. NPDC051941]|uniref:hypothetical protein n=1 Tax=Nonomuraea sp. NPDC051941 TaxID=3364373 RepID=UPI0037CC438F
MAEGHLEHVTVEALHHVRDVTYREDACRVRIGTAPRIMARLRNLAIGPARLIGWTDIAATTPPTAFGYSVPQHENASALKPPARSLSERH